MTKKIILVLFILFLIYGCQRRQASSPVAINIDGIKITVDEFEEAFRNSSYARSNIPSARREFLENLITRRLLLREAEKEGLDKNADFLKDVELFWQQSLLKLMLDRKTRELSVNLKVEDKEITDYYLSHKDTDYMDKELEEVWGQIKWLLLREKQRRAIEDWVNSLKRNTRLKINYKLLKLEK